MSVVDAPTACAYELDDQYRLVLVDAAWSDFALANGAPELAAPGPLGRTLWSFIGDPTTAQIYRQVFERVAQTQATIRLPLRCDAPGLRRFLDLHVSPRRPAGFLIRTTVSRVEPRPAVALPSNTLQDGGAMLRMCSWCKDVETPAGWLTPEDAVAALALFERDASPTLTHGICPDCYVALAEGHGGEPG